MNMDNYFLPHMGLTVAFPRSRPFLAAVVAKSTYPPSLHVDVYSIHHSRFEDYVCFASILSWPLLWLSSEVVTAPFPLFIYVEFHIQFPLSWRCREWSRTWLLHPLSLHIPLFMLQFTSMLRPALIPLDLEFRCEKDLTKTFYFRDVLNFPF